MVCKLFCNQFFKKLTRVIYKNKRERKEKRPALVIDLCLKLIQIKKATFSCKSYQRSDLHFEKSHGRQNHIFYCLFAGRRLSNCKLYGRPCGSRWRSSSFSWETGLAKSEKKGLNWYEAWVGSVTVSCPPQEGLTKWETWLWSHFRV